MELVADCTRCRGLCCVALPLTRSADFPIDKPAGTRCVHLRADDRCGIHGELLARGFRGCVAFDCFGAGQRVTTAGAVGDFGVVLRLHELLWYLAEAVERVSSASLRATLAAEYARVDRLAGAPADADPLVERDAVAPLLRAASTSIRATGAREYPRDLAGASMRAVDFADADLRGAVLIAADLRDATFARADLLGADLRGADLAGADLSQALFVTRTQLGSAHGDATTRLPARLSTPEHWRAGR